MICLPEEEEDAAVVGPVDFKREEVFFMPRLDGTGPQGNGAMTGRGQGRCNPAGSFYGSDSAIGTAGGRSCGRGRGAGTGTGLNAPRGFSGRKSGAGRGKRGRR